MIDLHYVICCARDCPVLMVDSAFGCVDLVVYHVMTIGVVVILSNVDDFHNDHDYGNESNDGENGIGSVNGNDDVLDRITILINSNGHCAYKLQS